ncbi:hypothetical protein MN116_005688 [Schistosoma mekongi]|uniref:Uncharacterized protein n=1 Tax=Schistosoma mekongi TaxID=38744 RepID=A0AAE1ZA63_SCHME|nr:hypothetical protein MN116_005688 [Schistosoma mekongi]
MDHRESNEVVNLDEFPFFHIYFSDDEPSGFVSKSDSLLSFNMFGTCSLRNVKRVIRRNRRLKLLRVHLLKAVLDLCKAANLEPFVYGGTALSVFRENGKFIPHDTDIDLGILEFDSEGNGSYTKLIHYCLQNGIHVNGVENLDNSLLCSGDSDLYIDFSSSIGKRFWLKARHFNVSETIEELPYNGCDCKRIKCFYSTNGLLKACNLYNLNRKIVNHILSDPSLVHVDLFTLSIYPDSSAGLKHLRVNWNLPGIYDCEKKLFPYNAFFPLKPCIFEDVNLLAPCDLQTYLSIEYGYLGRDAVYDSKRQLFIKIPSCYLKQLPSYFT